MADGAAVDNLPCIKDCVDQVSSAQYGSKFDLLKGFLASTSVQKGKRDIHVHNAFWSFFHI